MADHPRTPPPEAPPSPSCSSTDRASPSSGAFITNSRNFTIVGGNFTNVINCAPTGPLDFRTIPLGDLDLRNEIRLEDGGVVNRQRELHAARRIYSARIEGKNSDMTVAVYHGENAEETWKHELAKYSGLRHPNFVQLYGSVNSGGFYATIFHDALVPLQQLMSEYRHSVISTIYLYVYLDREFYKNIFGLSSGQNLIDSAMNLYPGYGTRQVDSVLKFKYPIPLITLSWKSNGVEWTTQHGLGNYVLSQLSTSPRHEDCLLVDEITYQLSFSGPSKILPEGYLFLCPVEDLQDDTGRWLIYTKCPAYWSLDHSGNKRLSPEASSLGFPSLEFEIHVWSKSWDESVYAALSRFHTGKGFDPDSQGLARHLGHPLYELSPSVNADSARIEEISSESSGVHGDPISTTNDSPNPQKLKFIILGALVLTLMVSWSHKYLRRVGD
ncbi:hypothetical protein C8R44DRAFT_992577 [Mycena epipterygia]|nr:hypothetical protein C8R44DRAFT_992577 [Mycena epipterygia]